MKPVTEELHQDPEAGVAGEPVAGASPERAIAELLETHGGTLYRLGLRICGTHEEAEDLVQDTFLLAYKNWSQFRGEASPKTWLYTIASRVCQRTKRLKSGQPKHIDSLEDLVPTREDRVPDVSLASPYEATLRHELQDAVAEAISELPLDFRMPLVLKDIADLSVRDIAAVLGIKVNTVKTRLHRARLHLRRVLSEHLPEKKDPAVGEQQICLDLVAAKQEAMDRGVPFAVSDDLICERCSALFATLDLTRDVCQRIGEGELPAALRSRLQEQLRTAAPLS